MHIFLSISAANKRQTHAALTKLIIDSHTPCLYIHNSDFSKHQCNHQMHKHKNIRVVFKIRPKQLKCNCNVCSSYLFAENVQPLIQAVLIFRKDILAQEVGKNIDLSNPFSGFVIMNQKNGILPKAFSPCFFFSRVSPSIRKGG